MPNACIITIDYSVNRALVRRDYYHAECYMKQHEDEFIKLVVDYMIKTGARPTALPEFDAVRAVSESRV